MLTPVRSGGLGSASVVVPDTVDVAAIVAAVGAGPDAARFEPAAGGGQGTLVVRGVGQAALEEAAAEADPLFVPRALVKAAARQEMARRVAAGMPWAGRVLQIDEASQARMTAGTLAAATGLLPPGYAWRMADDSSLALDPAGMTAMAGAALAYVYALRARYWAIVAEAAAAHDAAALAAIDPAAGWPAPG